MNPISSTSVASDVGLKGRVKVQRKGEQEEGNAIYQENGITSQVISGIEISSFWGSSGYEPY